MRPPYRPLIALALLGSWLVASLAVASPDEVERMREEARALTQVQRLLDWYYWSQGERSVIAETFKGHERLFSKDSVAKVTRALRRKRLKLAERRALEFLKSYLVMEFVARHTSTLKDEAQNAALGAAVKLPWEPELVPFKQLELLIREEKDPARRARMEQESAQVRRNILNPILQRKEEAAQQLARELGYASYVALAEDVRKFDLRSLIAEGERFLVATDDLYQSLLAEAAQRELKLDVAGLRRRSDLALIFKAPRLERFFPRELMLPAFRHFLAGIGLDMRTVAGTEIRVDDAPNPLKDLRPVCFDLRVPDDVRVSVKPSDGLNDFYLFFHEGGHALHFANTTTRVWEFQQLGPNALTEGFAELFGAVWDDPAWIRRYRAFVLQYNAEHQTQYPTLTDDEINEVVRIRVLSHLYLLRRHALAKLVYEAVLHGGQPKLWNKVYKRPTTDLMAVYRDVFSRAYGFHIEEEEALSFLVDVDELFYAADYSRAFGLAHVMHEGIRRKFGGESGDWYGNPEVGGLLRSLYADGQRLQPDEVAQMFGQKKLDYRTAEARLRRLLAASAPGAPETPGAPR